MRKWIVRDYICSSDPKEQCLGYYTAKIIRLGQSVYEWSDEAVGRLIERYLWEDGRAMIWTSEILGSVITRCSETAWNVNGDPIRWRPEFDAEPGYSIPRPELGTDECVVIYDLPMRDIKRSDCLWLCSQISDVNDTIRTQVSNQKTPMVAYAGSKKAVEKLKNAIVSIAEGVKALILDTDMRDQIQVLDFNAPYNVESLQQYLWSLESEMLEFLGIDSQDAFQKKERLIVDEQEGNDELLNYMLASGLRMRQYGARRANEMFGTDWSVNVQKLIRPLQDLEEGGSRDADSEIESE